MSPDIFRLTGERAPRSGIGSNRNHRRAGDDKPFDCWPEKPSLTPWPDCRARADLFDRNCERAQDLLYGDLDNDAGALSTYERHRTVEWLTAQYHHHVVTPWCREHRPDLVPRFTKLAAAMYFCRQCGVFGLAGGDSLVVAWESKCGHAKLCPDEARAESLRLEDRYSDAIAAHAKTGRVYKAWLTLPNYPVGRLQEGMRHIYKRFRDRFIRSNQFAIEGALVILEAPLSKHRDWNVHLNVILLTHGWLSYKELQEAWGAGLKIKQHTKMDQLGMHGLFAEMVKYSARAVPEKSSEKKHQAEAPSMIEWQPHEYVEWFEAHHPFRRTRSYGALYGVPRPERPPLDEVQWLGRIELKAQRYAVTLRGHNLAHIASELLRASRADLFLIRGDNSTNKYSQNRMRGPP